MSGPVVCESCLAPYDGGGLADPTEGGCMWWCSVCLARGNHGVDDTDSGKPGEARAERASDKNGLEPSSPGVPVSMTPRQIAASLSPNAAIASRWFFAATDEETRENLAPLLRLSQVETTEAFAECRRAEMIGGAGTGTKLGRAVAAELGRG